MSALNLKIDQEDKRFHMLKEAFLDLIKQKFSAEDYTPIIK